MGCDIHVQMQKKTPEGYVDVPTEYEENRHYQLFGWLADVRNGRGFAGIKTGDQIEPLDQPRGYPDDFDVTDDNHMTTPDNMSPWRRRSREQNPQWYEDHAEMNGVWMGDHSHSWFTWAEILAAPNPLLGVKQSGLVDKETFLEWDGESPPNSYCGDCWGPGVVKCEDPMQFDPTMHTHVFVSWPSPSGDFDYFLDEIRRLVEEHGEGRMVFGFDN